LLDKVESEDPFRVFALPGIVHQPNHFAFYGIEELTGHHGNELGRFIDMTQPAVLQANGLMMLRFLNVRYIVAPGPVRGPGIRPAFEGQRASVFEVRMGAPRAFLVGATEILPDTLVLDRLTTRDFQAWNVAILQDSLGFPLEPVVRSLPVDTTQGVAPLEVEHDDVRWVERGINSQTLEVDAEGPSLLVVSDNYYPAWRATVDGEPVPVVRADYSFRGVPVPAGTHEVRFEYHSELFKAATWTTLLSILLVVGVIVGTHLGKRRTSSRAKPGEL
jgi:hypothetical protein